jgi:hypothetical protein
MPFITWEYQSMVLADLCPPWPILQFLWKDANQWLSQTNNKTIQDHMANSSRTPVHLLSSTLVRKPTIDPSRKSPHMANPCQNTSPSLNLTCPQDPHMPKESSNPQQQNHNNIHKFRHKSQVQVHTSRNQSRISTRKSRYSCGENSSTKISWMFGQCQKSTENKLIFHSQNAESKKVQKWLQ